MPSDDLVIVDMQGVTVVTFRGTSILDALAVDAIGRTLYDLVDQRACRKIVLDFAQVRMISSQMVGALINLHKKSQAIKGKVVLCGLRPDVSRIFRITNLHKLLSFADDEQKALSEFGVFPQA